MWEIKLAFSFCHSGGKSGEKSVWEEIWSDIAVGNEAVVRLYIQEIIAITETSLQSPSWHKKVSLLYFTSSQMHHHTIIVLVKLY